MTSHTYNVNGMHCASCVVLIEDTLKKLEGVDAVSVKLTSEKAVINFSQNPLELTDLNDAIAPFGYALSDPLEKNKNNASHNHDGMDPSASGIGQDIKLVLAMVGFSFFMMMWQVLADGSIVPAMSETVYEFFHHLMPVFATFVLFGIGRKYLKAVWAFFRTRTANMDTLVGISTSVAFLYSFIVTAFEIPLSPYLDVTTNYYDVVIIVIGLIALGQHLEARAKRKTNDALQKLASLTSKVALVLKEGKEIETPTENVLVDDIVIVKPNERIPLDGIVVFGTSSIDESNLTGESIPVDKGIEDVVFAGTQNFQGVLHIRVTKDPKDTTLSNIIRIVENAQNSKAPVEKMADRISGVFVYVVVVLAVVAFIAWIIFGAQTFGYSKALAYALQAFMAVLVIACPCSLGLATPTAIIAGVGKGAERGILIKNAESLEKLSKVTAVVFDKTGTLTHNKLMVEGLYCKEKNHTCDDAHIQLHRSVVYSLAKMSKHPISESIAEWFKEQGEREVPLHAFTEVPGKGTYAKYNDQTYYLGSLGYIGEILRKSNEEIQKDFSGSHFENGRELYLSNEKEVLSLIKVHDTIKREAKDEIARLKKLGLTVVMATGDTKVSSDAVARSFGIDEIYSSVKPEDKSAIIENLQKKGHIVAMVGDGVNDAPALARAHVAISMSNGSDIAIESSDIVLLFGDIHKVRESISLARKTNRVVWQNLVSSFAYNSIGLPIAGGILFPFFGWLLSPALAGAIMAFESVTVVANSLRIKKMKL